MFGLRAERKSLKPSGGESFGLPVRGLDGGTGRRGGGKEPVPQAGDLLRSAKHEDAVAILNFLGGGRGQTALFLILMPDNLHPEDPGPIELAQGLSMSG